MDRWVIDAVVDAITDLRRKIEVAHDISKAAWHNEFGWLHPKKAMEAAEAAVEAAEITREDVADALGIDLAGVDAENARDRARQDQMSPGTWTTLPDGVGVDDWMFDITDPEDNVVIANTVRQTDGTEVGFHTFPTEADNAVSKGIWALITRNFSLASDRDMKLAEKALRSDPKRLAAIKSSVEGLQEALAQEPLQVDGWTTIPDGYEVTFAGSKAFPYWHDMNTESHGLLQCPDGHRYAVCRVRRTREGSYKLGSRSPFTDMFRGRYRLLYPDLDAAKTAAEDIFKSGLERQGLALAS